MTDLIINQTKNTPGVECKSATGVIGISGSSYPENTFEFYDPILKWIEQYMLEVTEKITLNMYLDYLNSSSIKFISDILTKLNAYHNGGGAVELNWYYSEDDDDIKEMGRELQEDTSIVFNLIAR